MVDRSEPSRRGALGAWPRLIATSKAPATAILMVGLPILAAAVTTHAFPPHDLGWIAWVGLVPLALIIPGRSWAFERYLGATIASLTFYGLGLGFIDTFNQVVAPTSPGQFRHLWLIASVVGVWTWPLTLLIARRLYLGCGFPLTASLPIAWVLVEHARHWFCLISVGTECPWLHLGYSQVDCGPVRQLAALGGMGLISFLIAAVNAAGAVAIHALRSQTWPVQRERLGLACAGLGTVAALVHGTRQLTARATDPVAALRVVLVPRAKIMTHAGSEVALLRCDLRGGDDRPDLILYGENVIGPVSLPGGSAAAGDTAQAILADIASSIGVPLVVGTSRTVRRRDGDLRHVCAVLIDPTRGVTAWADKSALVPFAESSPSWADHPWVRATLPVTGRGGDFSPAGGMGLLTVASATPPRSSCLGAAICYDVSSSAIFRTATAHAGAFLVLGNEPVDPLECTPTWLLNMTRCRAVECHRAVARTSIGGTTCFIDPLGRLSARTQPARPGMAAESLSGRIDLTTKATPYQQLGDWPAGLGGVAMFLGVLGNRRRRIRVHG